MRESPDIWMGEARREAWRADLLHKADDSAGAYFHAGQAVEFAMKAILLRRRNLSAMPLEYRGGGWHDLERIAEAALLMNDIVARARVSRGFGKNWILVSDWRSNARFPGKKLANKVYEAFYQAASHRRDGVTPWLETLYQEM